MIEPRITRKIFFDESGDGVDVFEVRITCPHVRGVTREEIFQRRAPAWPDVRVAVESQYENTMRRRAEELSCDCEFDVPEWEEVVWP